MSAASISHAIQSIGFLTDIRESGYVYPCIMATHLACIGVFGGLILVTDLRLLGLAFNDVSIADMINGTRIWKRLGFVIMFTMGFLLATSEMDKYYANPYFQLKMVILALVALHAWYFRPRVYDNPGALDRSPQIPSIAKKAAICSLLIWIAIPCLGRWIAYYEPPRTPTGQRPEPALFLHSTSPR